MTDKNTEELNILQGTLSFWIKENKIDFDGDETIPLFQANPIGGSIFVVKDSDKKIKLFHVYLGKGKTNIEYDASKLDSSKKHMIAFTWNVKGGKLELYVDGKLEKNKRINY